MTAERTTVAIVVAVLATGLVVLLSQDAVRLAGTNDVGTDAVIRRTHGAPLTHCQQNELLPAGTSALRLSVSGIGRAPGPALRAVAVAATGGVVAGAAVPAGWRGSTVLAHLTPAVPADTVARVCVRLAGGPRAALLGVRPAGGPPRIRIEMLRAEPESWWAFAPIVAERIGYVHAWSGPGIAVLAAVLMLAAGALALWLSTRARP